MTNFTTPIYPGVNPDEDLGPQLNIICVAFTCISFLTIVLRFLSRRIIQFAYGWDDWLIIVAAVFSWGFTAVVFVQVQDHRYGQHIGKTDPAHLKAFNQGLYIFAILYPVALTASKLSLLNLLYRIFGVQKAKIPMWIVGGLNIGWTIAAVLVGIFSCTPVQGFWNLEIHSTCVQEYRFFLTNECITITLDLFVILMPLYFIAQIRRSISQKFSIASTFALGLIVTVVSAVRLWQLVVAAQKPGFDPTFNETPAALWAVIELNIWIVVACIPALRPLVRRVYLRLKRSRQSDSQDSSEVWRKVIETPDPNLVPPGTPYSPHSPVRRKVPDIFGSLLDKTTTSVTADTVELSDQSGIYVDRKFEVTRPEEAHQRV